MQDHIEILEEQIREGAENENTGTNLSDIEGARWSEEAQQTLSDNVFKQDFLQGEIDGEFGPETMRACKRAKFWLGYKGENQQGTYGEFLHAQLTGKEALRRSGSST